VLQVIQSSSAAGTLCHPRTLTTFLFPFPLGIPPIFPCPSVALMPARTASISTPDGIAGEYADTRDLSAGWGSGGEGNGRPVRLKSFGFDFALDTCAPAVDFPVPVLDFIGFAMGGGTG
jgi:hypothetical protein